MTSSSLELKNCSRMRLETVGGLRPTFIRIYLGPLLNISYAFLNSSEFMQFIHS